MKMKLFFALLTVSMLGFAGCSDDEQTAVEINYDKTAEIKGYVSMQSTNKNRETVYDAAKNLRVFALVSYSDLTDDANAQGKKRYETTTDNKGNYTLVVPTTDKGTTVEIFTDRVEGTSYDSVEGEMKSVNGYFESAQKTIGDVKAGIFSIGDLTMVFEVRDELNRD